MELVGARWKLIEGATAENRPVFDLAVLFFEDREPPLRDLAGGLRGLRHGLVAGLLGGDLDGDLLVLLLGGEREGGRGCLLDLGAARVPLVGELGLGGPGAGLGGELLADLGKRILAGEKFDKPYVIPAKAVTFDNIDEYSKK